MSKEPTGGTASSGNSSAFQRGTSLRASQNSKNFNASGRKFSRSSINARSHDDLTDEIIQLKKSINSLTDENSSLKVKLRRVEDDGNKKFENEKSANNLATNNLKRKILSLEQTVKDKENMLKKLQGDLKAMSRSETRPLRQSAGTTREASYKAPTRASSSRSSRFSSYSGNDSLQSGSLKDLAAENQKLRSQLRRALLVEDTDIRNYSELGLDELISYIVKLNQDIDELKKADSKHTNSDTAQLHKDFKTLQLELIKVKEDRLLYFEELEKKDNEIKILKQEVEKYHKEFDNVVKKDGKVKSGTTFNRTLIHVPSATATTAGAATTTSTVSKSNISSKKSQAEEAQATATKPKPTQTQNSRKSINVTIPLSAPLNASTPIPKKIPNTSTTVVNNNKTAAVSKIVPPKKVTNKPAEIKTDIVETKNSTTENTKNEIFDKTVIIVKTPKRESKPEPKPEPAEATVVSNAQSVEDFTQNLAAKKIQKTWKNYREDGKDEADGGNEMNEVATSIQSAMRGHVTRSHQIDVLNSENMKQSDELLLSGDNCIKKVDNIVENKSETTKLLRNGSSIGVQEVDRIHSDALNSLDSADEIALVIQSAARGHQAREQQLLDFEMNGDK